MDPIIIFLRLLIPLSIFPFPFAGGLSSLFLDGLDWWINFFGFSNIHQGYQNLDKLLDIYYLTIEALVVWSWKDKRVKLIALGMFFYRVVGVVLFELTGMGIFLFIFPNIFENLFLFYMLCRKILRVEPKIPPGLLYFCLMILLIPKMIQEYSQHVALIWNWQHIKINIFGVVIPYDNIFGQLVVGGLLVCFVCIILRKQSKKNRNWTKMWKK